VENHILISSHGYVYLNKVTSFKCASSPEGTMIDETHILLDGIDVWLRY